MKKPVWSPPGMFEALRLGWSLIWAGGRSGFSLVGKWRALRLWEGLVGNHAARHTLMMLPFVVRIACGSALVCRSEMRWGFGHIAPVSGIGLSFGSGFGFGHTFRLGAWVCLLKCVEDSGIWLGLRAFCLDVRKSIAYAGMQQSEGKRSSCKESRKGCKRGLHPEGTCVETVSRGVCLPFVSSEVLTGGRRDSPGVAWACLIAHGVIGYYCWHILLFSPIC